jgi:GNAT superfamily N-acetyltransferase
MSPDHTLSHKAKIRLALANPNEADGVQAAIRLGNPVRATIGHMPFAGYEEAAAENRLLLAYHGEQVVGYALFGFGRRRVRLTHLCVDQAYQGQGIARRLVDWISTKYARGISSDPGARRR